MNVELSKRARRNSDRINARWSQHGDDPTLYAREFLEVVKLKKSKCHVYFVVDEKRELLTIVDVWNGQRGREPKL